MEAENDEATKGHDNTFSLLSILLTVQLSTVLAVAGYWSYPTIVVLLEGVILWVDWFHLVLRNIFFVFIIVNALVGLIYFIFLKTTGKKKPDLYDEYIAAVPSVVHPSSPEPSFAPTEVGDYGGGYYSKPSYQETMPPFQAVNTVEESNCYERVVMEMNSRTTVEEMNSKSYRRTTRLEKKMEKKMRSTVEYQKKSERVMKTSSRRSPVMMDGLSSEEFRMTVETFIMESKKKMYNLQNGVADHWQNGVSQLQNGVADHWQNGAPQLQNGVADHWQNGAPQLQNGFVDQWSNDVPQLENGFVDQWSNDVPQLLNGGVGQWSNDVPQLQNGGVDQWSNDVPQLQNGGVDQWQNGVPQLQNGGVDQWQNGVPQWQGQPDFDGTGRHRHRSRRLVGGSDSTSSGGPYLAISN